MVRYYYNPVASAQTCKNCGEDVLNDHEMIGGYEFRDGICTIRATDNPENPLYVSNADINLRRKGMLPLSPKEAKIARYRLKQRGGVR